MSRLIPQRPPEDYDPGGHLDTSSPHYPRWIAQMRDLIRRRVARDRARRDLAGAEQGLRSSAVMVLLDRDPMPDVAVASGTGMTIEEVAALRDEMCRTPPGDNQQA